MDSSIPTLKTSWHFTSTLLQLEETNEHNPDPNFKSSDGWGYALADWLGPKLARQGYKVEKFEPDTCGWSLTLHYERFSLKLACMVVQAELITNRDALELNGLDLWDLYLSANKPQASGGLLRRLFAQADPADIIECESRLGKLSQDIESILSAEETISFIVGESEFEE